MDQRTCSNVQKLARELGARASRRDVTDPAEMQLRFRLLERQIGRPITAVVNNAMAGHGWRLSV